jgi:hypothetical protein
LLVFWTIVTGMLMGFLSYRILLAFEPTSVLQPFQAKVKHARRRCLISGALSAALLLAIAVVWIY